MADSCSQLSRGLNSITQWIDQRGPYYDARDKVMREFKGLFYQITTTEEAIFDEMNSDRREDLKKDATKLRMEAAKWNVAADAYDRAAKAAYTKYENALHAGEDGQMLLKAAIVSDYEAATARNMSKDLTGEANGIERLTKSSHPLPHGMNSVEFSNANGDNYSIVYDGSGTIGDSIKLNWPSIYDDFRSDTLRRAAEEFARCKKPADPQNSHNGK